MESDNKKSEEQWIKASDEKPDFNITVLVFIPEEDNHITTGMWDISGKWVLLDDYRVPTSQVTYWQPFLINDPLDTSFEPTHLDEIIPETIHRLQKDLFDLGAETTALRSQLEEANIDLNSYRGAVQNANDVNKELMRDLEEVKKGLTYHSRQYIECAKAERNKTIDELEVWAKNQLEDLNEISKVDSRLTETTNSLMAPLQDLMKELQKMKV